MKPFARRFYKSRAWQECRDAYYVSQHGICERCGNAGVIVHHKEPLTPENINNPNITLNWDNLEVLCLDCHNKEHFGTDAIQDGLMFDEDGNVVRLAS